MKRNKTHKKLKTIIGRHELLTSLLLILLLVFANYGWNRYRDWDNAQMIKGLARDFPVLIAELEKELGQDLEIQNSCMQTQEKYGTGVKTCELIVVKNDIDSDSLERIKSTIASSKIFMKDSSQENERAYRAKYRRKTACTVSKRDRLFFECITAVRDANVQLAREAFKDIR